SSAGAVEILGTAAPRFSSLQRAFWDCSPKTFRSLPPRMTIECADDGATRRRISGLQSILPRSGEGRGLFSFKYVDDTNFVVPAPAYNLPGQAPAGTHFDLVEHGFPLARE